MAFKSYSHNVKKKKLSSSFWENIENHNNNKSPKTESFL